MTPRFERADRLIRLALLRGAELTFIIAILLTVTPNFQDFSQGRRLAGNELTYLINSGAIASIIYRETGAIPLWNPFMGPGGEPLLENPFSFVLNPFMTLPIFWFGLIQGPKVAVLLHVLIMALGGWTLAYTLGLRAPGRVALSLLLGGCGSMAGMIGLGFYQMSLSLAYMPWVLAGLVGLLYRGRRWHTGIFVMASALMVFAGTFWYVLPTAISGAVFAAFALVRGKGRRLRLDLAGLRRLLWASLLLALLASIRLIPQAVNRELVEHPTERLPHIYDLFEMARLYFAPGLPHQTFINTTATHFHYIVPLPLFLVAGGAWLALAREPKRWRILLPAALLIVFYTVWAQEGTPLLRWLYGAVPLLGEWRFPGRMLAAGAPLLALMTAVALDDVVHRLLGWLALPTSRKRRLAAAGAFVILAALAALSVYHVLQNWNRVTGTANERFYELVWFNYLRQQHPDELIAVQSENFFNYYPYYVNLIRAALGNPDYRAGSLPPTIGHRRAFSYPAAYGFTPIEEERNIFNANGYRLLTNVPNVGGILALWHNDDSPGYAFVVRRGDIEWRTEPLRRSDTLPVETYTHNVANVVVRLDDMQRYPPGGVLVISETAYPGWSVSINGKAARLESVGGRVGVIVPAEPAVIVFHYSPPLLHFSALVAGAGALLYTAYLLRLDGWVSRAAAKVIGKRSA